MATGTLVGLGLGALALGAGASVASGVMSKKSQEEANSTNIQLSREQMAYQTSEREAVQEYNTPVNQRARFEQAGINPYMALGNINSGNAEMQTGVTPAHVEPVNALAQMVQNLGQTPQQALNVVQQAQQVQGMQEANQQAHVESMYKEREILSRLRESYAKSTEALSRVPKNTAEYQTLFEQLQQQEQELKFRQMEYKYHEQYLQARNRKERAMSDLVYSQNVGQLIQNDILQMTRAAFPKLNQAQLDFLSAQTYQSIKSGELSGNMSEREKIKKIGDIIANGIASNQYTLGQLGMNEAQVESLRNGRTLDNITKGWDSGINGWIDHTLWYAGSIVKNLPVGVFFGK